MFVITSETSLSLLFFKTGEYSVPSAVIVEDDLKLFLVCLFATFLFNVSSLAVVRQQCVSADLRPRSGKQDE